MLETVQLREQDAVVTHGAVHTGGIARARETQVRADLAAVTIGIQNIGGAP
jgi:hypothetical protein